MGKAQEAWEKQEAIRRRARERDREAAEKITAEEFAAAMREHPPDLSGSYTTTDRHGLAIVHREQIVTFFDVARRKWLVRVHFEVFSGVGHHIHVSVREESTGWWNPFERTWTRGARWLEERRFDEKFFTKKGAFGFVKVCFEDAFSTKTHRLVWAHTDRPVKWAYKDGD